MEEIRMNIKNNKNCKITINDEGIAVSEKEKYITERKAYNKISYEVNVYNLGKKKYLGKYATLDEAKKVRDNYLKTFGKSYIK